MLFFGVCFFLYFIRLPAGKRRSAYILSRRFARPSTDVDLLFETISDRNAFWQNENPPYFSLRSINDNEWSVSPSYSKAAAHHKFRAR